MGTFRGGPEQVQPLAGNGFSGVYKFHGLAEVFRARMVRGVGLNGAFPMVNRRDMYFHVLRCGALFYPFCFPTRAAEHINNFKCFFTRPQKSNFLFHVKTEYAAAPS
jgi:hypothetical protein